MLSSFLILCPFSAPQTDEEASTAKPFKDEKETFTFKTDHYAPTDPKAPANLDLEVKSKGPEIVTGKSTASCDRIDWGRIFKAADDTSRGCLSHYYTKTWMCDCNYGMYYQGPSFNKFLLT